MDKELQSAIQREIAFQFQRIAQNLNDGTPYPRNTKGHSNGGVSTKAVTGEATDNSNSNAENGTGQLPLGQLPVCFENAK
jgi:hypothetical protein